MPDLTELRRLLEEVAQPRPWTSENDLGACIVAADDEIVADTDDDAARLIVAAVNALPELLAAAEALERVRALVHRVASEEDEPDAGWNAGRENLLSDLRRAIDGEPQP